MPSRAEKTVAMYQSEQAESYTQAVRTLEERGKIDSDASEGEKLATLSRVAVAQVQTEESASDSQKSRIPWDTVSFVIGIVGLLLIVGLLIGSVAFAASVFLL
ncbi:hypothetical protein [Halapricum hydrolyticum]|uniref:Uncharacterized protein n=1 Tax=Halapricum hydrolyticum TaxID=2979991 RepID=A0AAE3IDK3_9EURY|nr:hypothetical protein [Halapricum hydrolyticum]MCU4718387.1 hypothetical protein [Halapricum hydrolyticum]MCU4726500.1 hypothetical protein [Halapricum hydrolyticum]